MHEQREVATTQARPLGQSFSVISSSFFSLQCRSMSMLKVSYSSKAASLWRWASASSGFSSMPFFSSMPSYPSRSWQWASSARGNPYQRGICGRRRGGPRGGFGKGSSCRAPSLCCGVWLHDPDRVPSRARARSLSLSRSQSRSSSRSRWSLSLSLSLSQSDEGLGLKEWLWERICSWRRFWLATSFWWRWRADCSCWALVKNTGLVVEIGAATSSFERFMIWNKWLKD